MAAVCLRAASNRQDCLQTLPLWILGTLATVSFSSFCTRVHIALYIFFSLEIIAQGRGDLLAHHQLKLVLAQPALFVTQLPVTRDAEEVCVRYVELGLEGLRPNGISNWIFHLLFEGLQLECRLFPHDYNILRSCCF